MSDFGLTRFPSGILGGDGRRIRPGNRVTLTFEGAQHVGEVTGWAGRLGVEVSLDDDPFLLIVQPHEIERLDELSAEPYMVGVHVVDPDPRPTAVVIPLGGRDIQARTDVTPANAVEEALLVGAPSVDPGSGRDLRRWTADCRSILADVAIDQHADIVHRLFDMPMLRRTIDESVLPVDVDRIIPVVTDQDEPQSSDTVGVVDLMRLWLRGRGHLDNSDPPVRPVGSVDGPIVVRRLPFQLDAVVHQIGRGLDETLGGVERASVVIAGGTPAMMYGTLIAVGARLGPSNTTSVQVPQDWTVQGQRVMQPLVEMSLEDASFTL